MDQTLIMRLLLDQRPAVKGLLETQKAAGVTGDSLDRVGNSSNKVSAGQKKFVTGMRQTSMQLSQVAQQASITGDYIGAMAIQLPDLGLAFGIAGTVIGALAGSFLMWAKNANFFATTLMDGKESVKEFKESMDALAESEAMLKAPNEAIGKYKELIELMNSVDERNRQTSAVQVLKDTGLDTAVRKHLAAVNANARMISSGDQDPLFKMTPDFDFMGLDHISEANFLLARTGELIMANRDDQVDALASLREAVELRGILTTDVEAYIAHLATELGIREELKKKGDEAEAGQKRYYERTIQMSSYQKEMIELFERRAEQERLSRVAQTDAMVEAFKLHKAHKDYLTQLTTEAQMQDLIKKHGKDSLEVKKAEIELARRAEELRLLEAGHSQVVADELMRAWDAARGISSADMVGAIRDARLEAVQLANEMNNAASLVAAARSGAAVQGAQFRNYGANTGSASGDGSVLPSPEEIILGSGLGGLRKDKKKGGGGGGGDKSTPFDDLDITRKQIEALTKSIKDMAFTQEEIQILRDKFEGIEQTDLTAVLETLEKMGMTGEQVGLLADGLSDVTKEAVDAQKAFQDIIEGGVGDFFDQLSQDIVDGKAEWEDYAAMAIRMIGKIAEAWATAKIGEMFAGGSAGGGGGGGAAGSGIGSFIGGLFKNIKFFGTGGVVSGPTSAVVGESGPEAIMPVTRLPNGQMGVKAMGGGGSPNININNYAPGVDVSAQVGRDGAIEIAVERAVGEVTRQLRSGGPVASQLESNYRMRRQGT